MSENEIPPTPPEPPSTPEPPMPPTPPPGPTDSNRGVMIVLSYLWVLTLIPLLLEKDDAEVQWHAKHGLVLFAAEIIVFVVLSVIGAVSSVLGCLLVPLWMALMVAILVVHVICIVKGLNGERFLIPGISQYADRF